MLQADPRKIITLREDQVGSPFDADGMYGWTKLMGEQVLSAYAHEFELKTVSCRYFTAYGQGVHRPEPIRGLGHGRTGSQLDLRFGHCEWRADGS